MIFALLLACAPEPPPPVVAPKVIVVVTDTMRVDRGGAPRPEWMTGGREYTAAYSAAPYTPTSVVTLTTGRYAHDGEEQSFTPPLPADAWPTTIATDQPVVAKVAGQPLPQGGVPGSVGLVREATADLLAGKLGAAAYIHTHGAHEPYDGILPGGWQRSSVAIARYESRESGMTPDLAGWTRLQYRSAVEHALAGIAPLISAARASGAVVIWTADHGEALGEGNRWGHGRSLDDEQIRVPLYVWGPGVTPGTDPAAVPATCVGQTARLVLGEAVPDACDLRDGTIRGDVVSGMLLADGTWDERIISAQATP